MKSLKMILATTLTACTVSANAAQMLLVGASFDCVPSLPFAGTDIGNRQLLQCLVSEEVRDQTNGRVILQTGTKLIGEFSERNIQWLKLAYAGGAIADLRLDSKAAVFQSFIDSSAIPPAFKVIVVHDVVLN